MNRKLKRNLYKTLSNWLQEVSVLVMVFGILEGYLYHESSNGYYIIVLTVSFISFVTSLLIHRE